MAEMKVRNGRRGGPAKSRRVKAWSESQSRRATDIRRWLANVKRDLRNRH